MSCYVVVTDLELACSVDQPSLELNDPPLPAFPALELKGCATTLGIRVLLMSDR